MSTSAPLALTFRAATPSDIPVIADLLTQLNRAEGKPDFMEEETIRHGLFAPVRRVDLRALLAVHEGVCVGVALYYVGYDIPTASDGYHLGDLVVDAGYRRQGVGRALFTALAKQNLDEGGEWIALTALTRNAPANAFYKLLGMTQVAVNFFAVGKHTLAGLIASDTK